MVDAALSMLSLCRKAGKLKMGFDAVEATLPEAKLVLFTSDVSPKTRQRMLHHIENTGTRAVDAPFTSDQVHFTVGKRVAILAVTDRGLSEAVLARFPAQS